jgi:hypothetical protein
MLEIELCLLTYRYFHIFFHKNLNLTKIFFRIQFTIFFEIIMEIVGIRG